MGDELDPKQEQFELWVIFMDDTIREFISTLPQNIRDKLDYSLESLDIVEEWVLKTYPNRKALFAKDQRKIFDGAACYVGQIFRKELGGYWDVRYDSANRPEPIITGFNEQGSTIAPHAHLATVAKKREVGFLQFALVFHMRK